MSPAARKRRALRRRAPWRRASRRPLVAAAVVLAAAALGAGLAAALSGCGESEPATLDEVTLQLNWFHEAEFIGYYVSAFKGFYEDEGLNVAILEGGPGKPARDSLLDGSADFAISSFAEQKDLVAKGGQSVAVMAAFQIPPLVIFSLSESGIDTPADLAGRRVGVTTDYWGKVLTDTLKAAGVDASSVAVTRVKPEDMDALYDRRVDAWLGYAQDEPIKAETAGHEVKNIYPADYGVGGYEGLLLVKQRTIVDDPDLVRRFVRASRQGWQYAIENPDEAARILLAQASGPDLRFQELAVRAVGPLVDVPQVPIGWIDEARWQRLMGPEYDSARPGYTMRFFDGR